MTQDEILNAAEAMRSHVYGDDKKREHHKQRAVVLANWLAVATEIDRCHVLESSMRYYLIKGHNDA